MADGLTIGVAGMTGTGKTSWLRQEMADEHRLIVFDTRGEHDWLPAWEPENNAPYSLSGFLDWLDRFESGEGFQIRIVPPGEETRSNVWLEFIGKKAYMLGDMTVAVEEADLYSSPAGENPGIRTLHNYSRNRGVSLIYLTRVVNSVNRLMTANTKGWILFRLEEPRYLESLDARFDFDVVTEVGSLADLEYIRVNPDRSWTRERIVF
jgi:hypothetical protein